MRISLRLVECWVVWEEHPRKKIKWLGRQTRAGAAQEGFDQDVVVATLGHLVSGGIAHGSRPDREMPQCKKFNLGLRKC